MLSCALAPARKVRRGCKWKDTLLADQKTLRATGLEERVEGTPYSVLAVALSRLLL